MTSKKWLDVSDDPDHVTWRSFALCECFMQICFVKEHTLTRSTTPLPIQWVEPAKGRGLSRYSRTPAADRGLTLMIR